MNIEELAKELYYSDYAAAPLGPNPWDAVPDEIQEHYRALAARKGGQHEQ